MGRQAAVPTMRVAAGSDKQNERQGPGWVGDPATAEPLQINSVEEASTARRLCCGSTKFAGAEFPGFWGEKVTLTGTAGGLARSGETEQARRTHRNNVFLYHHGRALTPKTGRSLGLTPEVFRRLKFSRLGDIISTPHAVRHTRSVIGRASMRPGAVKGPLTPSR